MSIQLNSPPLENHSDHTRVSPVIPVGPGSCVCPDTGLERVRHESAPTSESDRDFRGLDSVEADEGEHNCCLLRNAAGIDINRNRY